MRDDRQTNLRRAQGKNASHYKSQPLIDCPDGFAEFAADILAVEHRYHAGRDIRRADGLAGVVVRAITESFLLHGADHVAGAALALSLTLGQESEMSDLGSDKEHGRAIRASGGAGSATDAGGGIHGGISHRLRNKGRRGIWGTAGVLADEATGTDDPIVGTAVDHEVLHDREGADTEGLNRDGLAILKLTHVDLTGSSATRSLRNTVDHHVTGSADALATIAGKGDRLLTLSGKAVVHDIEHLEEGALGGNFRGVNLDKLTLIRGGLLLPESEMKIHGAHDRKSCRGIGDYL